MDEKFHYNTIHVLAHRAGFDAREAEILSYASQYTDHATEHKPIAIANLPPEASPQAECGAFNPICSAHEALQYVTQWRNKDAQRKTYISFHFLPPEPYTPGQPFEFAVKPNSTIARNLLTAALADLKASPAGTTDRLRHLIRSGIALHGYADTWAHQGFSGRHSPTDNDVRDREIYDSENWTPLPILQRLALDAAPDVGHAEVLNMPDHTDLKFRYRKAANSQIVERDNTELFLDAAKHIYEHLCLCTGRANDFASLALPLRECFADSRKWSEHFSDVLNTTAYDRMKWRKEALEGDRHDWDRLTDEADFAALSFRATGDLKWFLFHVEAAKHREFVLSQIAGARL